LTYSKLYFIIAKADLQTQLRNSRFLPVKVDYIKLYLKTAVLKMEDFVTQALLYDFYGELLTENQKRIYAEVILEDYSISEVAKDEGVSRQSVFDMVKRCEHTLMEYESKLNLVKRFMVTKELARKIKAISERIIPAQADKPINKSLIKEIEKLAQEIIDTQ
jgi:UPF0122 protein BLAHAN_05746